MTPALKYYLEKWSAQVDRALDRNLPQANGSLNKTIYKAMRYSIFAGGKRLRPALVVAGAEMCGKKGSDVLSAACALEMIHTYSLIHDDLPAMDDDDLRRGRPTSHKVFGEGIAILAGDSLLTHAFELIAKNAKMLHSERALAETIQAVAQGAGYDGMIGGQAVDLEMDGGQWLKKPAAKQKQILSYIHRSKTAALIEASILAGAHLAKGSPAKIKALKTYGEKIGVAFQIADDILDIVGDKKLLGKKGSDRENKKLTYPAIYGLEDSKKQAKKLVQEAKASLSIFGNKAAILRDLADYIIERTY